MNEFIKAEKSRISGMLASYNKQVEDITGEMLGIDAKYKALAKKEKEALSAALSVLKDLIKGASKMYAMLDSDTEEKTEEKVTAPVIPDETEQVVDNLFPENNEPEENESAEEVKEESTEEKELDLANMNQDDTVLDFEKEESTEEVPEEEFEEE